MKRSDVWWVNFDPSVGGEIKKKRPAIIVSNNASNKFLNRVQVIPLRSKIGRNYPSEVLIDFNNRKNTAMADQIATVSKQRLINHAGNVSLSDMLKIEHVVKIQLGILK